MPPKNPERIREGRTGGPSRRAGQRERSKFVFKEPSVLEARTSRTRWVTAVWLLQSRQVRPPQAADETACPAAMPDDALSFAALLECAKPSQGHRLAFRHASVAGRMAQGPGQRPTCPVGCLPAVARHDAS